MELDPARLRLACARTCRNALCTGKGSDSKWAHRCSLDPQSLQAAPVFTTREIPESPHPSPSERREPHPYGPHDPTTAPTTVTVLGASKWPRPEDRPLPAALIRQRAAVNQRAHHA